MYIDYGPKPTPKANETTEDFHARARRMGKWINRPFCEMCGPFRGRRIRQSGHDEFGPVYRCEGCDNE